MPNTLTDVLSALIDAAGPGGSVALIGAVARNAWAPPRGTRSPRTGSAGSRSEARAPRQGDARKALRRSDATSALGCGRNPEFVAAELGHTTSRMVVEVYDSFLDPARGLDELERTGLVRLYGWPDLAAPQDPFDDDPEDGS
jgi:hypothetical protein